MEGTDAPNDNMLNALKDIVQTGDFGQVQMEFIKTHCDQFKDNSTDLDVKYIDLQKNYVSEVLEAFVDPKMASFAEAEQNSFYKNFKKNLDHYKAIDEGTVDIMQGFDDLAHFTELMKSVKKSLNIADAVDDSAFMSQCIDFTKEEEYDKLASEDVNDKALGY